MTVFPRIARLDAVALVRELVQATDIAFSLDGECQGGQVGAALISWPDGHRSVLTCQPTGDLARVRVVADLLAGARAAGVPAPRYELTAELPSAVAVVQELLPGRAPTVAGLSTVRSMIELNGRCRGLLFGSAGLPAQNLFLLKDGPGFCLHEPLQRHSRRAARLLGAIEEVGASVPQQLTGDDLVHFDFHPGNVLVDQAGTVTGVVDWDGVGRGNGDFDLYTLRFDLAHRAPELGRWLGARLSDVIPDQVALACWAHMSLRMADWSIRHFSALDIAAWLHIAEELMPPALAR